MGTAPPPGPEISWRAGASKPSSRARRCSSFTSRSTASTPPDATAGQMPLVATSSRARLTARSRLVASLAASCVRSSTAETSPCTVPIEQPMCAAMSRIDQPEMRSFVMRSRRCSIASSEAACFGLFFLRLAFFGLRRRSAAMVFNFWACSRSRVPVPRLPKDFEHFGAQIAQGKRQQPELDELDRLQSRYRLAPLCFDSNAAMNERVFARRVTLLLGQGGLVSLGKRATRPAGRSGPAWLRTSMLRRRLW